MKKIALALIALSTTAGVATVTAAPAAVAGPCPERVTVVNRPVTTPCVDAF